MITRTGARAVARIALACALLVTLLAASACTSGTAKPGSGSGSGAAAEPGVYPKRGGRVEVVGTLVRSDLEGGFWAVAAAVPSDAEGAQNAAVIANGDQMAEKLTPLEGRYVRVTGTPLNGASTRMAGPEITADSIAEVPVP